MTFRALLAVAIAMLVMAAAPQRSDAATGAEIDADVYKTLQSFERQIGGARDLAGKAAGILVFPSVVKAGIGLGGEYGEGLLIIRGRPGGYYNIVSGSFGFQLGVQVRSVIIMFMTESALASFSSTYGWKAGVDGSIAIVTLGAGGAIDTENSDEPGARLHPRSGGAHVQSDAGRFEDQPHHALSVSAFSSGAICGNRPLAPSPRSRAPHAPSATLHCGGGRPRRTQSSLGSPPNPRRRGKAFARCRGA